MNTPSQFHLIYRPAENGQRDHVVDLIQSNDPEDMQLQLRAAPELIALQLDAEDIREAALELHELGFSW